MTEPLFSFYGDDFTGSTDVLETLARAGIRAALFVAPPTTEDLIHFPDLQALGVAALNTTQREAIEETLDELATSRPDLAPLLDSSRPEPFFIKSLENVQGDERDTILISVGYGRAADGARGAAPDAGGAHEARRLRSPRSRLVPGDRPCALNHGRSSGSRMFR